MSDQKFNSTDQEGMAIALAQAKKAFAANEVPVGAVLYLNGKCIAKAHNLVDQKKDATMHAEIICLKEAAKILGDFRLVGATLYCTLEPCAMCAGAIANFRVKKVVWGAKDLRIGAAGTLYNLFDGRNPIHKVESVGGLMEEEAGVLLRSFFQQKREEKGCKNC